jgi:hypothetical protein
MRNRTLVEREKKSKEFGERTTEQEHGSENGKAGKVRESSEELKGIREHRRGGPQSQKLSCLLSLSTMSRVS